MIYNPNSGKRKKNQELENYINRILKKYHYKVNFFKTHQAKETIKLVSELENDYHLVILAGGDGTLNEGIKGNFKREKKLVLGSLPVGTVNDVASMYGYKKNYKKDLELLLNGEIKKIDTGFLNQQPFVYVACFGNYVDISYTTPRKLKEKYGKLGYILYGLNQMKGDLKQYEIEYEINDQKYEGHFSFIFITNSTHIAGINHIYQDVKLNDQMFEVIFCNINKKGEFMKILPSLFTMNIKKAPGIYYYRTNHLKIHFKEPFNESWCLDGEEYFSKEKIFDFKAVNEIEMLLPRKNIHKLFNATD